MRRSRQSIHSATSRMRPQLRQVVDELSQDLRRPERLVELGLGQAQQLVAHPDRLQHTGVEHSHQGHCAVSSLPRRSAARHRHLLVVQAEVLADRDHSCQPRRSLPGPTSLAPCSGTAPRRLASDPGSSGGSTVSADTATSTRLSMELTTQDESPTRDQQDGAGSRDDDVRLPGL